MSDAESEIRQHLDTETRSKRRRRWRWAALAVAAGLVAIAARPVLYGDDGAPRYRSTKASRGDLVVTVTATGTLQPTNQVDVGSELSGIIKTVAVDFNDRVQVGQALAVLDTAKLQAQVLQSEAALKAAQAMVLQDEASVEETRLELDRANRLVPKRAMSEHDQVAAKAAFKRAEASVANARAQVSQAEAALEVDRTNLQKAVIRSPINGVVLQRQVEPGQTVAATLQSPVLFTLAEDLTKMELQVDVDEADVGKLAEGQSATFTVDAYPERRFPAKITQVRYASKTVDGVVTYQAVLSVDNSDLLLRPGMTATADVVVQRIESALLVPNAALRFRPPASASRSGSSRGRGLLGILMPHPPHPSESPRSHAAKAPQHEVWILREQQLVGVPVTIGATDGRFTEIVSGDLAAGTAVVTDAIQQPG